MANSLEQIGQFLSKYSKHDTHIQPYTSAQRRTIGAKMTNITTYKIPTITSITHDINLRQLGHQ